MRFEEEGKPHPFLSKMKNPYAIKNILPLLQEGV